MNKIKYLLALIVFLATSCEIELKNDDTELPPELKYTHRQKSSQ